MPDIDLTATVDAAARAYWSDATNGAPWDTATAMQQFAIREQALAFVTASAPLIEAQVRAQIAADIEAVATDIDLDSDGGPDIRLYAAGVRRGKQIARGDS